MRPQYEVADIFRRYGEAYRKTHAMTEEQHQVMAAIIAYRTARLGGHQEICDHCGTARNCYNSCRPKCLLSPIPGYWLALVGFQVFLLLGNSRQRALPSLALLISAGDV
jgi:hypothetical protein